MRGIFLLVLAFCIGTGYSSHAQVPDTLTETVTEQPVGVKKSKKKRAPKVKKPWPDPKKAVLLSIIPGAGQIYNKRWWKLPIVYGAFGGLTYAIIFNSQQTDRLQDAYLKSLAGETHEFSGTSIDSPAALRNLRDRYDKNLQLSYIGVAFAYLLTGVDAFVDAHLRRFDLSDDLSLQARPKVFTRLGQPAIGLGLTLDFGR